MDKNALTQAAEAYSPSRDFPLSDKIYRLELEHAFMAGAMWYNTIIDRTEQQLKDILQEVPNAR